LRVWGLGKHQKTPLAATQRPETVIKISRVFGGPALSEVFARSAPLEKWLV
jgi:hypothetical protein